MSCSSPPVSSSIEETIVAHMVHEKDAVKAAYGCPETPFPPLLEFGTGRDLEWLSDTYLKSQEDTNVEESLRLRLVMTEAEVMRVVAHLARKIDRRYAHCTMKDPLLMVGILNGVAYFFSYLMKMLHIPYEILFLKVESYGESQKQRSGPPNVIILDQHRITAGRTVLLLDELEDNGVTMNHVRQTILKMGVAEDKLTTCVLFSKDKSTGQRRTDMCGIRVPDVWLVGWGLDYKRQKRGWKHLYGITKDPGISPSADDAIFKRARTSSPSPSNNASPVLAPAPVGREDLPPSLSGEPHSYGTASVAEHDAYYATRETLIEQLAAMD